MKEDICEDTIYPKSLPQRAPPRVVIVKALRSPAADSKNATQQQPFVALCSRHCLKCVAHMISFNLIMTHGELDIVIWQLALLSPPSCVSS